MASKKTLTNKERNLLKDALEKNAPDLIPLVNKLGIVPLSKEQRESLREALADELVKSGLNKDSEPNERGLLLDDIIGVLGYY